MRHDQRTDEDMRRHSDDIVTAAGHDQPKDRDTDQAERDKAPTDRDTDRTDRGNQPTTDRDTAQNRPERGEMPRQRSDGQVPGPRADTEATRPKTDAETTRPRTDTETNRPKADAETARPRTDTEASRPRADIEATRPKTDGEATGPRAGAETTRPKDDGETTRLFPKEDAERFRGRWQQIQTGFVDDPRAAVQGANDMLAEVIRALAAAVNERKQELEGQWRQTSSADQTEDLRLALRRYRSFANRLLEV